jgi:hypothetical protein
MRAEVENLEQLKLGDQVLAKYIDAAAVRLTNPWGDHGAPVSAVALLLQTAGEQIHRVSRVVAVDQPRGHTVVHRHERQGADYRAARSVNGRGLKDRRVYLHRGRCSQPWIPLPA